MFWAESFWAIALVMTLYSFFWNASLPQFEAVTFSYLKDRVARYARIRVWGSIGFIVTVIVLGALVESRGPEMVLPAVLVIFVDDLVELDAGAGSRSRAASAGQPSLGAILRKPAIIGFFIAVFLMQVSHGPYYAFYSIYMKDQGYSETLIGQLWALGVLAEVGLFVVMHHLLGRFGARKVLDCQPGTGGAALAADRQFCRLAGVAAVCADCCMRRPSAPFMRPVSISSIIISAAATRVGGRRCTVV